MTRQLDVLDIRSTTRRLQAAFAGRAPHRVGVAGPVRSESLAGLGATPPRPRRLESLAAVFSTLGSTGFSNPGEQIRAWTLWLTALNVSMLVALALALYAILR